MKKSSVDKIKIWMKQRFCKHDMGPPRSLGGPHIAQWCKKCGKVYYGWPK